MDSPKTTKSRGKVVQYGTVSPLGCVEGFIFDLRETDAPAMEVKADGTIVRLAGYTLTELRILADLYAIHRN